MIGRKTEQVLNRAVGLAFERHHEYFTLEHVLFSLLEEAEIQDIVDACNGNTEELRRLLEEHLDKEVPRRKPAEVEDELDPDSGSTDDSDIIENPLPTLGVQRLIQRALFHVQSAGKDQIQPQDLFVALFQSKDSQALNLLNKQGIERLDVLNYVSHSIRKDGRESTSASESEPAETPGREEIQRPARHEALATFTLNLNELARRGKIDPLIGRQNEIDRIIQILCRRRKNSPLLVGEAGVGKTALAEGLAAKIVAAQVPEPLLKAEVYSLDMGSLIAGTRYRGDFEKRLKTVIKNLQNRRDRGAYPILYIDEIHTMVGAGAVSGGALDAAHILKPLLSRGDIQCMGSTTYNDYRNVFEKDHALNRRFQKLDVVEPSTEETVQILKGLKAKFEEHHGVKYTDEAIRAAAELSVKHLVGRFLPDKAIDVLDEVGAKLRLTKKTTALATSGASANNEQSEVSARDVEEIIAQIARIPARSVSSTQKIRLKKITEELKLVLFGQDHAIEAVVTAIRLARSGLRTGEKPVGSFLFCGPTGVGKTELSRQLAHGMGVPFLRYDMSEYAEKHTISRLIGAPPGYVGFDQAGLLTDAVIKNPHSIVLLDEIEKAHPEIWNVLLQIMDHGTLTDNNGRKADFRNAIIIMTTNAGSREHDRRALGLGDQAGMTATASQKEVERTFSPEFRNRLDAIVYFNPLDPMAVAQIVGKQLIELESQLLAKNVEIDVDADVREWLARRGYDRQMGARPMARLIQDKIKRILADEILFGRLENGGRVHVSLTGDELRFEFGATAPTPNKDAERERTSVSIDR